MAKSKSIVRIANSNNLNVLAPVIVSAGDIVLNRFIKNDILRIALIIAISLLSKNKAFANSALSIGLYLIVQRIFASNRQMSQDELFASDETQNFESDLMLPETFEQDIEEFSDDLSEDLQDFQKDEVYL